MSCFKFEFEAFSNSRGASSFMRAIFPKNAANRENYPQIAATRKRLIGFRSSLVRRFLTCNALSNGAKSDVQ